MGIRVELSKIVEAMEMQSVEGSSYLDKSAGEVIVLAEEEFRASEDGDSLEDYPQWQQENIQIAREIIDTGNEKFLQLPSTS